MVLAKDPEDKNVKTELAEIAKRQKIQVGTSLAHCGRRARASSCETALSVLVRLACTLPLSALLFFFLSLLPPYCLSCARVRVRASARACARARARACACACVCARPWWLSTPHSVRVSVSPWSLGHHQDVNAKKTFAKMFS